MKKILFFAAVIASAILSTEAKAQTVTAASPLVGGTYGNAIDTVTNTAAVKKYLIVRNSNNTLSIQATAKKISGTMGGTAFPIASNDGITFVSIASVGDTITWTSASTTQIKLWTFPKVNSTTTFAPYLYYGVQFTGTGTMSASFSGNLVGRKE